MSKGGSIIDGRESNSTLTLSAEDSQDRWTCSSPMVSLLVTLESPLETQGFSDGGTDNPTLA